MFESTLANVIAIDIDGETIHFYSAEKGNQKNIHHDAQSYRARPFDDEFFEKLGHILKLHCEQNPSEQLQKVSLILPDQMFLMDTVNIPTIQKSAMQTSLGVAVRNIYKNADALEYKTFSAAQNKQFTTYGLVGIRKELITKLNSRPDYTERNRTGFHHWLDAHRRQSGLHSRWYEDHNSGGFDFLCDSCIS